MSERCSIHDFADMDPRCILDAGHSGDCMPAEVALAEALEPLAAYGKLDPDLGGGGRCGLCHRRAEQCDDDRAEPACVGYGLRALLARVRGGDHG